MTFSCKHQAEQYHVHDVDSVFATYQLDLIHPCLAHQVLTSPKFRVIKNQQGFLEAFKEQTSTSLHFSHEGERSTRAWT